jgi:hypothetical protein
LRIQQTEGFLANDEFEVPTYKNLLHVALGKAENNSMSLSRSVISKNKMEKLSTKQKRHLKELTELAYERDLGRCLEVLAKKFDAWRKNDISVWDLDKKIHEYHHEIARTLYEGYTFNNPLFTVAFGVARGVLSIDEVDQSCRDQVQSL